MAYVTTDGANRIAQILQDLDEVRKKCLDDSNDTKGTVDGCANARQLLSDLAEEFDSIDSHADLQRLPDTRLLELQNAISGLLQLFGKLNDLGKDNTPSQSDANELLQDCRRFQSEAFNDVIPTLAFLRFRKALTLDSIDGGIIKEKFDSLYDDLRNDAAHAKTLLAAANEEASKRGVGKHASIFTDHADKYKRASVRWLAATSFLITMLLAAGVLGFAMIYFQLYAPDSLFESIQFTASKLIVLSALSFAAIWSSKTYRATKHNETVCNHRAAAMSTFEIFKAGAADDATKDAVLIFCAQAAFNHRPTGYDLHDPSENVPQIVNPVIDVMKSNKD